ncbi:MAG: hypothetical protein CVV49_17380, partial [Spirochaetae bacterium HGW-Spirochaetae-5]
MINFKETLNSILAESELLIKAAEIKSSIDEKTLSSGYRSLTIEEIGQLKKQNNHAENWDTVFVTDGFFTSFIINSRFYGKCYLGRFTGFPLEIENEITLQSGIYDSTIKDSKIDDESLINRCGLIANYIISRYSVLYNINTITAGRENTFANRIKIAVGPETGERAISIFAEMKMSTAENLLSLEDKTDYEEFCSCYAKQISLDSGYIGCNCRIINTTSVKNSFISDMTIVEGASLISDSIILSSENGTTFIGSAAEISGSIIQWGCSIDSKSIIRNSLLMEYTHAERQCLITESIIGPNSAIGEAEITSSFAGPFTAAHHHSLLIAAIWPGGRGNMGYGANVGSNHTSRLPDQEILPGEGMFFGLGSSIKFPAEYKRSPYTVISTGAVTLPQKVEFPFSLITQPSAVKQNISPLFNELIPAWILSDNIYSVVRNESKYRKRNRSHRNETDFSIFRPDIIDMMVTARDRLKAVTDIKDIYTETEISGTGKNYITEKNRINGIDAYTFYIHFYALKLLTHRVGKILSGNNGIDISIIYEEDSDIKQWSHAESILAIEGLKDIPLKDNLEKVINQNNVFLSSVYSSKDKDFIRGEKIISDYSVYHKPTGEDQFIIELKNRT